MSRRDAALDALGIDRWRLRGASAVVPEVAPADVVEPAVVAVVAAPGPRQGPDDWDRLHADIAACTACPLHATRTQPVVGTGNRRADWLIVGEAPGQEEDRRGEPFVGRAGQLLDAMLRAIGLPRDAVYIANILKSRPPNNRDPSTAEVAACLPFLQRQIALLEPRIILVVGRIAAQNLLGTETPIGRLRGRVHEYGPARIPVIVTYHPAYLLRSPGEKRKSWEDLKLARGVFGNLPRVAAATEH